MTLSEFKAWFEGFTEVMDGPPNKKQWGRIQARVKEIDGTAITKTVFIEKYAAPYRRYWMEQTYGPVYPGLMGSTCMSSDAKSSGYAPDAFEAHSAMLDLGRAEYSSSPGRSIS